MQNYEGMATIAARNNAIVIRGTNRVHFEDEVLSWHDINGQNAGDLLPAILITNRNPHHFKYSTRPEDANPVEKNLRLILIPLNKFCRNATEVVQLIEKIFNDIIQHKALKDFRIANEVVKDNRRALADLITLTPANGNEIAVENVIDYLKTGRGSLLRVEKTVLPIHFEDRSGSEFERLVFAYVSRLKKWNKIEWLGQTGDDDGRDIWGEDDQKTYCYQCANYRSLVLKKVTDDIDKLVNAHAIPDCFIVVCGGRVSVNMRKAISSYAAQFGIQETHIWSGVELEEKLRKDAPELLKRFVDGVIFPELKDINGNNVSDNEIIDRIIQCFDRPAFTTPFHREVNIPDFEKAITDTIEVLNTGIHRLRDGTVIRTIPSRHQIEDSTIKGALTAIYKLVVKLRDTLVDLKRENEIKACECEQPDCPVYFFTDNACKQMDGIRHSIFDCFHSIKPGFELYIR
jgi:HJR/Mrr/RecB family endonuclease